VQNWDAVGRLHRAGTEEWLLVEAKAHVAELRSDCAARGPSRETILVALGRTKKALGVSPTSAWDLVYYQFCNRLATLYFLHDHGVGARLLFVYFTGGKSKGNNLAPADANGWRAALDEQAAGVGLPTGHLLEDRIHKLFLPVAGAQAVLAV
jgi:hypothetical protein